MLTPVVLQANYRHEVYSALKQKWGAGGKVVLPVLEGCEQQSNWYLNEKEMKIDPNSRFGALATKLIPNERAVQSILDTPLRRAYFCSI